MNFIQTISQAYLALPDKFDKMIVLAAVFMLSRGRPFVVSWYTHSSLDSFVSRENRVTRGIFQA